MDRRQFRRRLQVFQLTIIKDKAVSVTGIYWNGR